MFLNVIQIAESFGVSEGVVEGWVRNEGMPHTLDRGRFIFEKALVTEWAAAHGLAGQAGFLAEEATIFVAGCQLTALLKAGGIWRDVPAADAPKVIDKVVAGLPGALPPVRQLLTQRLRSKGGITWAPIGDCLALPHPSSRIALGRDSGTLALLLLREPFHTPDDNVPITRMFFFIAPTPRAHLDLLGRLSRRLKAGPLRELALKGAPDDEIFAALSASNTTGVKT